MKDPSVLFEDSQKQCVKTGSRKSLITYINQLINRHHFHASSSSIDQFITKSDSVRKLYTRCFRGVIQHFYTITSLFLVLSWASKTEHFRPFVFKLISNFKKIKKLLQVFNYLRSFVPNIRLISMDYLHLNIFYCCSWKIAVLNNKLWCLS